DYPAPGRSANPPETPHHIAARPAGLDRAGPDALNVEEAAFIGTSRGGLIIHVLGALRPAVLKAIVLNDIGPVIEAAGLAHIQTYLDPAPKPKSRAGAVEAQRIAHGADFPALTEADWKRMVSALYRETDEGLLLPDFDTQLVETVAGLDVSKPLPDLWPQFEALAAIPLLAIRGANSKLLSADTLDEMQKRHPGMDAITVDGQGHAPFLETGNLPSAIAAFLDEAENLGRIK
ncbi:alpha/beta hydrolase, partial [Mesorhizobium sp. M0091]|uniref:alpha/beta fold hydrolase n=1 Tax=Mesorhizobium sp. M0091 TaxID=2956875 RepID=UPI00333AC5EB